MSHIKAIDKEYIINSEDMNEYLADEIAEQMLDIDATRSVLKDLILGNLSNAMLYERLFSIAWRVEKALHRKNKEDRDAGGVCGAI